MFHRELFLLGEVKPSVGQLIQIVELLVGMKTITDRIIALRMN